MTYKTLQNRLNKAWSATYGQASRLLLNRYYDDLFARIDTLLTYEEYDMLLEHWIAARDGKAPPDVQAIADRVNADPVAGPLLKNARHYDELFGRAWRPGCVLPKEAKR
jgi:hypothetical protein